MAAQTTAMARRGRSANERRARLHVRGNVRTTTPSAGRRRIVADETGLGIRGVLIAVLLVLAAGFGAGYLIGRGLF